MTESERERLLEELRRSRALLDNTVDHRVKAVFDATIAQIEENRGERRN